MKILWHFNIAVEKKCSQELAFEWLDRYFEGNSNTNVPHYPWTQGDIQDISKYRQQGTTWNEIGSYYGVDGTTVFKYFKRNMRKCLN